MEGNNKAKNNFAPFLFWGSIITLILIFLLCSLSLPGFLDFQTQAKVSRVQSDHRSVAVAIEAYNIDYNSYPPMNLVNLNPELIKEIPSLKNFSLKTVGNVTSPISYISTLPKDPFLSSFGEVNYGYYYREDLWILYSCGPDQNFDINPEEDFQYIKVGQNKIRLNPYLLNKIYDPTNGNNSKGDIISFNETLENVD